MARGVEGWVIKELQKLGAPFKLVPRIEMDQMVKTTQHQGLIPEVQEATFSDLEAPFQLAQKRHEQPLLVLLG